jgi:DNA-binding response OmpR family regulator
MPLQDINIGDLEIHYSGAVIRWKGQTLRISDSERLMLMAIVRAGGHPVKRWVLAEAMGSECANPENVVAIHLGRVNAAFREIDPGFTMIANVRSQGLRWAVEDA